MGFVKTHVSCKINIFFLQGILFQNNNCAMSGSGSENKMTEKGKGITPQ